MTGTMLDVTFPSEQFALEDTLKALKTVEFDVEQIITTDAESLMPYIWVHSVDRTAIEDAFDADDTVADYQLIAEFDDDCLYRLTWVERISHLLRILVDESGTVLSATGEGDTWYLRLLFPDHDSVTRTHEYCKQAGIDMNIRNITEFDKGHRDQSGLSDSQRTTLRLAHERGYYSIPRDATAEDLAAEIGVTHQAVSERLRRGHGRLVEHSLINGPGTPSLPDEERDTTETEIPSE